MIDVFAYQSPWQLQENLGKRFKKRRKEMRLSQSELAERSGVSLGSVRRWEQTGDISMSSFVKLMYAMGREQELDGLLQKRGYSSLEEARLEYEKEKRKWKKSAG